jgi:hypothetical protein
LSLGLDDDKNLLNSNLTKLELLLATFAANLNGREDLIIVSLEGLWYLYQVASLVLVVRNVI